MRIAGNPLLPLLLLASPAAVHAQAVVTGTVTDLQGVPLDLAYLSIEPLRVTTWTTEDGTYRIDVPDALLPEPTATVTLRVQRIGHRTEEVVVRLERGQTLVQDFILAVDPLRLDEIVVTGQGLQAQRRRVGSTINTVRSEELTGSYEPNVINALAAKAPNVEVLSTSGDPGIGSHVRIRGSHSIIGGSQPLLVVDGTPISNASDPTFWDPNFPWVDPGSAAGPGWGNRAMDLNPSDIESIEILKGPAAASVYGSRAANGVVLITTKSGRRNTSRATFSTSLSIDRVTQLPQLQSRFGQGLDLSVVGGSGVLPSSVSWGPELEPDAPVYDHAGELFETGLRSDNSLILSGGTERTTYFFSLGYLYHDGTIRGRSAYERVSTRLNASHDLLDRLTVRGSLAYTTSRGDQVSFGSDLSGMLLGALRTPPEFNNLPYRDPATGLHRSYQCNASCLSDPSATRGYDNPFWVSHEVRHDSDVDRAFGNVTTDYTPVPWLRLRHILGFDFASDRRSSLWPQSSSDLWSRGEGRIAVAEFIRKEFDHSLLATVTHTLGAEADLELTLGQNLNQATFDRLFTEGVGLIENAERIDFAAEQTGEQFESTVRTAGYFARASAGLWDELFLGAGLRYDGSDTFGGDVDPETGKREPSRYWYPELSASWEFGQHVGWLDVGRVRTARGESGTQPPPYSNVGGFVASDAYHGLERVESPLTLPNTGIKPERTVEWEVGGEAAVWGNRLSLGVTRYWQKTTDAILALPTAFETGYREVLANGASWRNWGWEITLEARPVVRRDFSWTLGGNLARNRSMVDELLGAESVWLEGFTGTRSVVTEGHPYGVLWGTDFVRFGRGLTVEGVDIDNTYGRAEPGTLYIGEDGFPVLDPQFRVIGDPNPDWTASLRSTFSFRGAVQISALVDIKKGGDMWNGTKGALYTFGTHKDTEPMHGPGADTVFAGVGPGAGKTVTLNWDTWGLGPGSSFSGPSSQFVEDAGYVKLRELTVSFALGPEWLSRLGFEGLDVSVGGRNLATWTDYSGIDPESNLGGQSTERGLEYFNHPQTRSVVIGLTLRR